MRCLVTGAAGFIGSHLCDRLLRDGHQVLGLDVFSGYYPRSVKEANLDLAKRSRDFALVCADLVSSDIVPFVREVDTIFHLAGQPGVRGSWGRGFDEYVRNNILGTQVLLETVRNNARRLQKVVFASSSSVYGNAEAYPTPEDVSPVPISPYGLSKLAGEQLCNLYNRQFGLPIISVRYFTVYGPRQRPDMAIHRFMEAVSDGREVEIYGDGRQTRDFTYVSDAVEGTLEAAQLDDSIAVVNIGGGSQVSIRNLVGVLGAITGLVPKVRHQPSQSGDVRHTSADISRARKYLGYSPRIDLETGIREEWAWFTSRWGRRGLLEQSNAAANALGLSAL